MSKYRQPFLILLFSLFFYGTAIAANAPSLNASHPDRYVVQRGDTLWDISGRFLQVPWRWPEIWYVNPQVQNPHLIYPGDIIELSYVNGKPRLSLRRGSMVKLSPRVRTDAFDSAIPTIPISAIQQFLTRPYVLDKTELNNAPYIVSFGEDHIIGSTNMKAYVRSLKTEQPAHFDVVRPGKAYRDGESGEILGYEGLSLGSAKLQRTGDPATVMLTDMELEFIIGDRLIPESQAASTSNFIPKAPDRPIHGSIISVLNGVSQIGQYNIVVLDRGRRDGLTPGHVLDINRRGLMVRDTVSHMTGTRVKLPDEPAGTLMVFRVFERVSFGLVMHATNAMHLGDRIINPN
ncbi:MAG: LysM peptidoglycan-binding domain-containing protein [Gammaproteobacteria bacterium]|nr:LysM peptidoglycan-binding domain-containing protein [Gammaproteobacteria bacterium]